VPFDPHEIAEIEPHERSKRALAEAVAPRQDLDLAAAVDDVEEGSAAVAAARGEAPGDAIDSALVFATGRELGVALSNLGGGRRGRVGVREGVDPRRPEALELGATVELGLAASLGSSLTVVGVGHAGRVRFRRRRRRQTSIFVIFSSRAGPRGTCTCTTSPRLWPISALPTGDSLEILFCDGSASAEPTICSFCDLPVF